MNSNPPSGTKKKWSRDDIDLHVDVFLNEYLAEKSKETRGTYGRALNEFCRWVSRAKKPIKLSVKQIDRYKIYLMEVRKLRQVSVSTYLTAVRRFCQYLVEAGLLETNPARTIKGNRRPANHSRDFLDETEIEQLIAAVTDDTQIAKRDRALIYLMLFAGLGEIELIRANMEDLVPTDGEWQLTVQGKGRTEKDQDIPVSPEAMDQIRLYLDTRGPIRPEDPLFVSHGHRSEGKRLQTRSVRVRVNGYLKAAGLKRPGISPHSLTHTAALTWLSNGMSLEEVKRRMRHGTIETTRIYARNLRERGNNTRSTDQGDGLAI